MCFTLYITLGPRVINCTCMHLAVRPNTRVLDVRRIDMMAEYMSLLDDRIPFALGSIQHVNFS